jgi:hypothetical protein
MRRILQPMIVSALLICLLSPLQACTTSTARTSTSVRGDRAIEEPVVQPASDPVGRTIVLDEDVLDIERFELAEGDTLVIQADMTINAKSAIILQGTVRVELPEVAQQGARAPRLRLIAGEHVIILGEMTFGDGRDGIDPGVMGGVGASLFVQTPLIAIGAAELKMGNGGKGGPGVEGGGGGIFESIGWVMAFHPDGLTVRGGRGGDGGHGPEGTRLHPRGHRGGNGGIGGLVAQYTPTVACKVEKFESMIPLALGISPRLDPYVNGLDRMYPEKVSFYAGDGGDGGNGGAPYEPIAETAGGGRGGDGGNGGQTYGAWGLPGAPPVLDADGKPVLRAESMNGSGGGSGHGGDGGNGGDAGPGVSNFIFAAGGYAGTGGDGLGGFGGDAAQFTEDTPTLYRGRPGVGGLGSGGNGGNPGRGHYGLRGGDGGDARAGEKGK